MTRRTVLSQLTFSTLTMIASACAAPIYVASSFYGVSEYDSATGAPINIDFISDAGVNAIALSGNTLFVASHNGVGEYNATTGAAINPNFISGLNPSGLAVSGNILFVTNSSLNGTVGEYDATTGAAINPSFISGLLNPSRLAVSANTLFVSSGLGIGDYNATTGAAINANLIPGSSFNGLALSGNTLFVTSGGELGVLTCGLLTTLCIGEYNATTGAAINPSLITLVGQAPGGLALMGNNLFVAHSLATTGFGVVGEFNATTGAAINRNLISGLGPGSDIAISPSTSSSVPEPSTTSLIAISGVPLLGIMLWKNRPNAGLIT